MSPVGPTYDERPTSLTNASREAIGRDIAREVVAGDVGAGGPVLSLDDVTVVIVNPAGAPLP